MKITDRPLEAPQRTYLRENFPNLKAIGLDFVSLASYSDGKDGDLAHQIMLGMYQPGYICIVEDINMEELPEGFLKQGRSCPADHCRDRQLSCHHVGRVLGITLGGSFMAFLKRTGV